MVIDQLSDFTSIVHTLAEHTENKSLVNPKSTRPKRIIFTHLGLSNFHVNIGN